MIYAAEHYSTVLLEQLVRGNGSLPSSQRLIEITIPNGVSYVVVEPVHPPGWDDLACTVSKAFGEKW